MNKHKFLKNSLDILKNGCLIFTIITLVGYSSRSLLGSEGFPFILGQIWLVFLFSVTLAAANKLLTIKKANTGLKLLIHFTVCAILYFTVIVLFGGRISDGGQIMIAMGLFLVLYVIFAIAFVITSSAKKGKKNKKEAYNSVFK